MNQGGYGSDPNAVSNYQGVNASQGHIYSSTGNHLRSSSTGPETISWNSYATENSRMENSTLSTSGNHYDPKKMVTVTGHSQDVVNSSSSASASSNMGSTNVTQGYANYAPYSTASDPYAYSTNYQNYYGYQQSATSSSTQQVEAYQNSGAPYSSFNHTGSYAVPASYPSTYYNAGGHQTAAGYSGNNYASHPNYWNAGTSCYAPSQYMSHTSSDNSSTQVSNLPTSSLHYQQHSQWPYYNQSAPTVNSTAENILVTSASTTTAPVQVNQASSIPSPYPSNQPPPPGTTSWGRDPGTSLHPMQVQNNVTISNLNDHRQAPPASHNQQLDHAFSNSQKPLDSKSVPSENGVVQQMGLYSQAPNLQPPLANQVPDTPQYHLQTSTMSDTHWRQNNVMTSNPNARWGTPPVSHSQQMDHTSKIQMSNPVPSQKGEAQQMGLYSQGSNLQASTYQVPETSQYHLQTSTMPGTPWVSKVQIPTNPKIASGLALGMTKTDKEASTPSATLKPAFISVQVQKPKSTLSSNDDVDAVMKGTFPPSLRRYVERTFARCMDDSQRAANQKIMKEVITKATVEGSLFTRNWDVEPLFALPNSSSDAAEPNNVRSSVTFSMLPKFKRSPNRRTKSRWEPVADDKLVDKIVPVIYTPTNGVNWSQPKGSERLVDKTKVSKDNGFNGKSLVPGQQTPLSKMNNRPKKKLRLSDPTDGARDVGASSDSDKEESLTKYYASAITLANSPEEKKRREHRFKRFEKGQESHVGAKHYKPKVSGSGNIYNRKASAILLAKSFDDNSSRAVEDIDWDALTVKGTCQEVEKRYLRLTSAPDPATVRPEEILEKALTMVQTSQKNYLYKCDQLKSIRQDLTVQRIQNELTVKVYETHARLALEAGDLPEYNQCQSKLKILYGEGIRGCDVEFSAYNLLCIILHSNNKKDLLPAMRRLSSSAKESEAVKHALAVRSSVSSGNYILFFRLYKDAPNLNACLMDLYVEKMRFEAIKCISKSYRPTVPVAYISCCLGFSSVEQREDEKNSNSCEEWLKAHGAIFTIDNNGELHLDAKASSSTLYMPEPEDAVSHGDASLAVNDFLTRASS